MTRVDDWVREHYKELTAPLERRTVFTQAGRQVVRSAGERMIYGPDGKPIRVITDEHRGTTVTTDNIQAVHLRPRVKRLRMSMEELRG